MICVNQWKKSLSHATVVTNFAFTKYLYVVVGHASHRTQIVQITHSTDSIQYDYHVYTVILNLFEPEYIHSQNITPFVTEFVKWDTGKGVIFGTCTCTQCLFIMLKSGITASSHQQDNNEPNKSYSKIGSTFCISVTFTLFLQLYIMSWVQLLFE